LWAFLVIACAGCAHVRAIGVDQYSGLVVEIWIVTRSEPIFEVVLRNQGSERIAIANLYGVSSRWIRLAIREERSNKLIRWPVLHVYRLPRYDCLEPGESIKLYIDIRVWQPQLYGQSTGTETVSYDYVPGPYRIQASYKDWAKNGKRKTPRGCPAIVGEVNSDWVQFEVPEK